MKGNVTFGSWQNLLSQAIESSEYSSVFYIVDQNVSELHNIDLSTQKAAFILASEPNKNLDTLTTLWNCISSANCDRKSVVVCIGGGFITDVGGFAASTFMRGIQTIYIPTTVLGMVDAAIGGKTGINYHNFKNRIGSFHHPSTIIIDTEFLQSLPEDHWWSGYAELIKHALISDRNLWVQLCSIDSFEELKEQLPEHLSLGIAIKKEIVSHDYKEKGIRKKLNFGHTIAHALESLVMEKKQELMHGHAVAAGIMMESHMSCQLGLLKEQEYKMIKRYITRVYPIVEFEQNDVPELIRFMLGDKKSEHATINCTLLNGIGNALIDQTPSIKTIELSLRSYIDEYKKL